MEPSFKYLSLISCVEHLLFCLPRRGSSFFWGIDVPLPLNPEISKGNSALFLAREAKGESPFLWIFITGAGGQSILSPLVDELEECEAEQPTATWECLSVVGENGINWQRKGQGNAEEGH